MPWEIETSDYSQEKLTWNNTEAVPGKIASIYISPSNEKKTISIGIDFLSEKFYQNIEPHFIYSRREVYLKKEESTVVTDAANTCAATITSRFKIESDFRISNPHFALTVPADLTLFDSILNFINEKYTAIDAKALAVMKRHARDVFNIKNDKDADQVKLAELVDLLAIYANHLDNSKAEALYNETFLKLHEEIKALTSKRFGGESLLIFSAALLDKQNLIDTALAFMDDFDKDHKLNPKEHAYYGELLLKKIIKRSVDFFENDATQVMTHLLQGLMKIKNQNNDHVVIAEQKLKELIEFLLMSESQSTIDKTMMQLNKYVESFKIKEVDLTQHSSFYKSTYTHANLRPFVSPEIFANLIVDFIRSKKTKFELVNNSMFQQPNENNNVKLKN